MDGKNDPDVYLKTTSNTLQANLNVPVLLKTVKLNNNILAALMRPKEDPLPGWENSSFEIGGHFARLFIVLRRSEFRSISGVFLV